MGRHKTVDGATQSNVHSFYCAPDKWLAYQGVAKELGVTASVLLRMDIDETLAKHGVGLITLPEFDVEAKILERTSLLNREGKLMNLLSKEVSRGKTDFVLIRDFAIFKFGTDAELVKNIDAVLVQLKNYVCSGSEPFSASALMTFIVYLETVLKRRSLDAEIRDHWRKNMPDKNTPKSNPLLVTA